MDAVLTARLTNKVLRGIVALSQPRVAYVIRNPLERAKCKSKYPLERDVDDAIRALDWAQAMMNRRPK